MTIFLSLLKKTRDLIRIHQGALLLALCVGFLTVSPQLFAIYSAGKNFQGIYPIHGSDDLYYQARVKEVLDGHINISNPYLFEHKDGSEAPFWLPDFLIGIFAQIFTNSNLHLAFILLDFILPFLLFILIYAILLNLSINKELSLSVASFLNLGLFFDSFNRSPSPQLNFLFFLTCFLIMLFAIKNIKWYWFVFLAVNLGLLFYIYPYYWTFFYVFITLFIFINFVLNKKHPDLYKWVLSAVGGVIIGIPYLINTVNTARYDVYKDTVERLGMIYTRFPSGSTLVFVATVSLLVYFTFKFYKYKQKISAVEWLLVSSVFASIIVSNHHMITGQNLEFSSHYLMPGLVVSVFLFVKTLAIFLDNYKYKKIVTIMMIIFVSMTSGFFIFSSIQKQIYLSEEELKWQDYKNLLVWLDDNIPKDSVIMADNNISSLVPIYTDLNVFYVDKANLHFVSNDEIYRRFILNYWDKDIDQDFIKTYERYLWRVHYINNFNHSLKVNKMKDFVGLDYNASERLPQAQIDKIINLNQEMKINGFDKELGNYTVDYLVVDITNGPISDHYKNYAKFLYRIDDFEIYKITI